MNAAVSLRVEDRVAFIAIDNPPVNSLSLRVRAGLYEAVKSLNHRDDVDGVVVHGTGRAFSAGGNIREFGTEAARADPGLSKHIHPAIEGCPKTVVAAIRGYALGGGLETALACDYRVATADARIGLPEARIGVIPLSATQRLPRLVGIDIAIDMIVGAREREARDARAPLIHAVAGDADLLKTAALWARKPKPGLVKYLPYPADDTERFARARADVAAGVYPPFATHLLEAMTCGMDVGFDEGLARARALYDAVVDAPQAQAQRTAFLQSRGNARGGSGKDSS